MLAPKPHTTALGGARRRRRHAAEHTVCEYACGRGGRTGGRVCLGGLQRGMCRTLIHCHSFDGVHRRIYTNTLTNPPRAQAPKPQRARSLVVDAVIILAGVCACGPPDKYLCYRLKRGRDRAVGDGVAAVGATMTFTSKHNVTLEYMYVCACVCTCGSAAWVGVWAARGDE